MRTAIGALAAAAVGATIVTAQPPPAIDFGRDVQPILRANCYSCHGPTVHQNNLRLDRRADAMRGGTGTVIGRDSATSRLYKRITGTTLGPQMPPAGALKPEQIDTIKQWIDSGAAWPDELSGETPPRPTPPLMRAVLANDLASVRRLLDQGADPNATNDAGATALMWAVGDLAMTRLLVDHGASVNATSDAGRTPLMIAAGLHGASDVVKLLLDRGAKPSAAAPGFGGMTTPVVEASYAGESTTLRLLRDAGADMKRDVFVTLGFSLHADCTACADLLMPFADAKALAFAPLVLLPPQDGIQRTKQLYDRGADANLKLDSGRTPLMRAAAGESASPDLIQTLIARGADVHAVSPSGETALEFARRHGHTPIVDLLTKAGADPIAAPPEPPRRSGPPLASPRAAVERSLPLLQQTDETFLKKTGCVSCHNNTLTAMSVSLARSHGVRVDEDVAQSQDEGAVRFLDSWREDILQNGSIGGDADTISYILLALSAEAVPASDATDAMARFLLRRQMPDGRWLIASHRPPIESSEIEVTAASMRSLQVYASKGDRRAADAAVRRAAAWLLHAIPTSTDARAFQLLGLGWSRAGKSAIQSAARALVGEQRSDGGWSQLPTLGSDAYATGEALVALEESGALAVTDAVYRRGVDFLLRTQLDDGSWYVRSRAIPIQLYFESGFPHGHDQFISAAATNWAVMALSAAVRPGS